MITHIYKQPNSSKTHPTIPTDSIDGHNKTPAHNFQSSIIKVKNTTMDFRIIAHERSLFHAASSVPALKESANLDIRSSQNQRLTQLGLAVTAIYNFLPERDKAGIAWENVKDICEKNPKQEEYSALVDPAQIGRGAGLINDMLASETTLDSTLYTQSLNVGIDYQAAIVDPFKLSVVTTLWNLRDRESNAPTVQSTQHTSPSTTSTTH